MPRQRLIINGKKFYQHPVFTNYAASKDGEIINVKTKRILKPQLTGRGYYKFSVCDKSLDRTKNYRCHRFIYEAIRGVILEGFEIDHINNCKKFANSHHSTKHRKKQNQSNHLD